MVITGAMIAIAMLLSMRAVRGSLPHETPLAFFAPFVVMLALLVSGRLD